MFLGPVLFWKHTMRKFLFIAAMAAALMCGCKKDDARYVVILSMDGFRYDLPQM